jgi:hypothetical protein
MTSPGAYLLIPPDYAAELRGLRWAPLGDAVETDDTRTFALVEEIGAFLEGFASRRPLLHFAHVLHLMYLLRQGQTPRHDFGLLARPGARRGGRPARRAPSWPRCATKCRP